MNAVPSRTRPGNSVDEAPLACSPSQEDQDIFRKSASEAHPLQNIDYTLFRNRALRHSILALRLLVATKDGRYPHIDDGMEVRHIFHKLHPVTIENSHELS